MGFFGSVLGQVTSQDGSSNLVSSRPSQQARAKVRSMHQTSVAGSIHKWETQCALPAMAHRRVDDRQLGGGKLALRSKTAAGSQQRGTESARRNRSRRTQCLAMGSIDWTCPCETGGDLPRFVSRFVWRSVCGIVKNQALEEANNIVARWDLKERMQAKRGAAMVLVTFGRTEGRREGWKSASHKYAEPWPRRTCGTPLCTITKFYGLL